MFCLDLGRERGLRGRSLHAFSPSVKLGATAGSPAPFPPQTPAVSPPASPRPSGECGTGQGLPEPLGQAPWVGPGTSPVQVDVASSPAHPPAGLPGARVEVLGVGACGGPVGGRTSPETLSFPDPAAAVSRAAGEEGPGRLGGTGARTRAAFGCGPPVPGRSLIWMGAGSPGRERALHASGSDSCKCSHGVCGVTRFPDTGLKVHVEKRTFVISFRLGVC